MMIRWIPRAAMLSAIMIASLRAAEPTTVPNAATSAIVQPQQYPVPYVVPSSARITESLDHIRERLEMNAPIRIIDQRGGAEIADLSKPNPMAVLDRGPEQKFSQLTYPFGVIDSGLLLAADATGDKHFSDYVVKRYQFFADNLPKLTAWGSDGDWRRNPFAFLIQPNSLDACGAMGAAMIKARRASLGPDMKVVIDRWAEYVSRGQFRLDDGTLARGRPFPNSLWADDMYMSVPLLAQMGKLTGDNKYYDDATKQVVQMSARLFVPEKGLFAHGWSAQNAANSPRFYWGRANGWCMMAMAELLDVLPVDHPKRAEVLRIFQAHVRGIAEVQSGSGLWHQLLDRPDSYLESSSTGMFVFAIARGVNSGWLDAGAYGPVAVAGWNGLSARISDDGKIDGTCVGTSYADDMIYYYHRPMGDDVHGYGPTLLAGAEMIRLLKNDNLRIGAGNGGPVMFRRGGE